MHRGTLHASQGVRYLAGGLQMGTFSGKWLARMRPLRDLFLWPLAWWYPRGLREGKSASFRFCFHTWASSYPVTKLRIGPRTADPLSRVALQRRIANYSLINVYSCVDLQHFTDGTYVSTCLKLCQILRLPWMFRL